MGQHYAYHRSATNRYIHWLMIPLELMGVLALLTALPSFVIHPLLGNVVSCSVILAVTVLYVRTEPLCGLSAGILLFALQACFCFSFDTWFLDTFYIRILVGVFLFLGPNLFQTQIGHGVFEGRDDTALNLSDFVNSKDVVPLLLIFYYHWVEAILLTGYRPLLANDIAYFERHYQVIINHFIMTTNR
jgi:uncharacterized membrane protein YGL010W